MTAAGDLERDALACILPGFEGAVAPDWLRRRLADGLGGVVLFGWNVERSEQLRELSAVLRSDGDVLVGIDEEGGDVTRLEVATGSSYPGNAALGAVDDVDLTERVAASIGADLAEVGVNLNLAPVADVNTNPLNPVIGIRSFGADGELVARHVAAFVRGLQNAGVAACAKHFPGHGDTAQDSHLELPVVESLQEAALLPFRAAIAAGVQSIMSAHIVVRSHGVTPATMNGTILRDLLRGELRFDGLVLTDALEMRAISATVAVEEGAVRALQAGADALCLGHDLFDDAVQAVRDALVGAVRSGRLAESRVAEAAQRVRRAAIWASREVDGGGRVERDVGREAARRALRVVGDVALTEPPVVVELEPAPSMAAGPMPLGPAEWFRNVVPEAEIVRPQNGLVETALAGAAAGRRLVILTRDAHRHEWSREVIEQLVGGSRDAVLVELGLPYWHPGSGTFVATYGAGRVNVEAAAEALYSRSRRGVEQSGSSPGS
jgi:beta-N-acetylhexosaminidase